MTTVTLYYWDQCIHCTRFKPTWDELKNTFQGSNVKFQEYENNKDYEIVEKANIDSFPTIRIKKNNKEYDYTGERTIDGLTKVIGGTKKKYNTYEEKYRKYKQKYLHAKNTDF